MVKVPNSLTIPRWFERHFHGRDGDILKIVLESIVKQRATGAIFMPNLGDPISNIRKTLAYRDRIDARLPADSDFVPCLTLYLTDDTDPNEVVTGFKEGVFRAVKLYMAGQRGQGGTTGSAHGVQNLIGRYPVFEAMEKHRIPLLGHFEAVEEDIDEFDREIVSTERDVEPLLDAFPGLPVVFEHLTDGRAADFVSEVNHEIYATVTAHHLMINRNAMFWIHNKGRGMSPGHYCLPVAKREKHRLKVRKYVTSGNKRFGAGTDSAYHDESVKSRCYGCAAGIITTPAAVEMYTTVFDEDNALQHLGSFLSENFVELYGMDISSGTMTIERRPFVVPQKLGGAQVFMGGRKLPWKLID
jgi:dihydroorotase